MHICAFICSNKIWEVCCWVLAVNFILVCSFLFFFSTPVWASTVRNTFFPQETNQQHTEVDVHHFSLSFSPRGTQELVSLLRLLLSRPNLSPFTNIPVWIKWGKHFTKYSWVLSTQTATRYLFWSPSEKVSKNNEHSQQPSSHKYTETVNRCTKIWDAHSHTIQKKQIQSPPASPARQSCVIIQTTVTSVTAALTISVYSKAERCVTWHCQHEL